jgi:hypothetical protein
VTALGATRLEESGCGGLEPGSTKGPQRLSRPSRLKLPPAMWGKRVLKKRRRWWKPRKM